ncbi:retrovirus-related pol polyprotein from transposon TNT 1-94, partial [Tanacetum coccineum]
AVSFDAAVLDVAATVSAACIVAAGYIVSSGICDAVEVQTALFKEVKVMEEIFDQMNNEVDQNTMDKQCAEIVKKNLLIENENLIANSSQEAPDFNSFFKIKNLEHQIREKDNVIRDLKVLVFNVNDRSYEPSNAKDVTALLEQNEHFRAEIEKVKQHYKELFESIKVTHASTNDKTSFLLTQIEDLKAQLEGNLKNATRNSVKTKVLAPETVREIVEEARVVKPLDTAFNSACKYTKLSQELVEYVIGTCPKEFKERDNKAAAFIPLIRPQKVHQSNVTMIPSTGVSISTEASGSKPRSNTTQDRILPAKSVNKKKVEDHPRTNKSVWTKLNRVDSSISSKRVVINLISESAWKICNKCLNSANHEMCVVNILKSVNGTPTVKTFLNNRKQIWKPKGKLSDNSLNKTKQVWKATRKLLANVSYQWRPTGKKFTLGKLNCGYQWRPTRKKFALGDLCPLTRLLVTCGTDHPLVSGLRLLKTYDGESFKAQELRRKVHRDNLEVAFRKHLCFVSNMDGVDLLKGCRTTNLYTIFVDEMLRSSPICLLSTASKSKSWLWHRRLNHLNFGTINDLARKDLVRGLPRLEYEKDHLCSACQLGKSKKFSHKSKSENTNMEVLHTLHMDLCGPMRV